MATTPKNIIKRAWQFVSIDIWRITGNELSQSKRIGIQTLKKIILTLRGFFEDNLMIKASALTYNTLLAIVPVLALIIAIGKGFGMQDSIERFINDLFSSHQELIPYILNFVNNYLSQAQGGLFVGIGVAILLWSVMSMFRQIESNFNDVWEVKKSRSIARQFTTYFSLMLLVPVFIVIATSLSSMIDGFINAMGQRITVPFFYKSYKLLIKLLPYLVYWVLFTLIFVVIPNTKVKFLHALFAGIVTGTLFQLFQYLYITGQINLTKYNAVYGSFAFLPLLLFWLQISWVIVLFGAKLCYVSQNLEFYNFENETKNISRRYKDYTTIIVLKKIITQFDNNAQPITSRELAAHYNIPIQLLQNILRLLLELQLVREVYTEQNEATGYIPALDTHKITLALLMQRIEQLGEENFKFSNNNDTTDIWPTLVTLQQQYNTQLEKVLIKDL